MLQVVIPETEFFNSKTNEFTTAKRVVLNLEHSLVSLSRWEARWQKPFLSDNEKTHEESIDYIRCMTISQNVPDDAYYRITPDIMATIQKYIDSPMTATWFSDKKNGRKSREVITAEIIYYWMIQLNIPFECQKWHLNRLLTLIKVCDIKSAPAKKMSKKEILNDYRNLNAQRRAALGSKG